jgi:ankyrin repeat protein
MMAGGYIVKTPEEHAFDAVLNKVRSDDQAFAHVEVEKWIDEQAQKLELSTKPAGTPLPEALQKQLNQLLAKSFEKSNFLVMCQLLKAGADANGVFEDDPMLRWAINQNSEDGVALLVKHGAKTETLPTESQKGFNAYVYAWAKENKPMAHLLEQLGASKQGKDHLGRNLLCLVAQNKDIEQMNLLLDEGFPVTDLVPHPDNQPRPSTVLSYVMPWLEPDHPLAERLLKPIVEAGLLMANGSVLWERIGDLPQHKAAAWADKLMASGLEPNLRLSVEGETPWLMAAKKGNVPLMKVLFQPKGQIQNSLVQNVMTQQDGLGRNALMLSVSSGNPEAFLYLKSLGFSLDVITKQSEGLLHEAMRDREYSYTPTDLQEQMLETLIQAGVPLNTQDFQGKTPLHRAVELRSIKLAEMLLKAGANPLLKTISGQIAVELVDRSTTNPYLGAFSHDALNLFYILRDATFAWQAKEKQTV